MFQCETRSHIGGNSWSQEIYNHIIIFNADACSGQNSSISFTEEACLNQINWTCDNEWHYLITNLINVISQSTNWTVQKRNWHQKQHPLADKKCDVSLSDHVRVNRKKPDKFKSFYSRKVDHFSRCLVDGRIGSRR